MSITSIYVGNLPYATKAEDLKEIFSRYGTVSRATVILDRETNRPRGFAFVEMPSEKEAEAAVAALSGYDFQGRPLTVNCARNNVIRGAGNTSQAAMRPGVRPSAPVAAPGTPTTAGAIAPGAPAAAPSRGYHNRMRDTNPE